MNVSGVLAAFEVLRQGGMLGHFPNIFPVFFLWKAHNVEYSIELVMMVGIARFDIFLSTVKNWLRSQQFGEDTSDGPNI